jgi:hypothetical protein
MNIMFVIIAALIGLYIIAIRKESLFAGVGVAALVAIPFQPVLAISCAIGLLAAVLVGPVVKTLFLGIKQSQID